ncbi:MAG TPA: hypothetical protein VK068_03855 [Jeotgalicoccus sp.]|nr:hypothetical protein [Jeotgalicoccus sp.]
MNKKFSIEFDEVPSLLFVQRSVKLGDFDVYQDGKIVKGIKYVDIDASYDSPTTHRIVYATGFTKERENKSK